MTSRKSTLPALLLFALVLAFTWQVLGSPEGGDQGGGPHWWSVLPPVVAIGLALITRQVIVALVLGIWLGATLISGNPAAAFLRMGDTYLTGALADSSHAAIVLFSSILGGMVGVLSRSGATEGIVHWLSGRVGGRRGGMVSTSVMGTLIFFDDYANTLLVGSTMRPLTDRLNISREKLAWLVDSTAAPVTTVAVISTWVGFEVGLLQDAMASLHGSGAEAYTVFLRSIPFSFYPLLMLLFVYLAAFTGRDFGPMLTAERRAVNEGLVLRPGSQPASDAPVNQLGDVEEFGPQEQAAASPLLAGVPILAVILTTALGLYFGGRQTAQAAGLASPTLREVLNNADSFAVLTWAALVGALLAIVLSVASRRLGLREALDGYVDGTKSMLIAITILILAWSLSAVCEQLDTAGYLVGVSQKVLSAHWLPAVVFVLAAAVSFATGTSWGTMAILMPLVYPMGVQLPAAAGLEGPVAVNILLASVSAVLAGAVWGDHCSPISDTTIMSSLASGCDHVDHVRTQMPYALSVGAVAIVCGYLPAGFGLAPWFSLALGTLLVLVLIFKAGRLPQDD
jgi:Na+/H+ antiporter NhaC